MSDPRSAVRTTTCPDCEDEQLFGVEMRRDGDVWRCARGHERDMFARAFARAGVDPFAERDERREIREALREDTSRRGRDVPPSAGGGGNGRARKRVPKADERIAPKANAPGLCWRCGGPTGTSDARVRYCEEHADEAKREGDAERKRREREREREKGCA